MSSDTATKRVLLVAAHTPGWEDVARAIPCGGMTCEWMLPAARPADIVDAAGGGSAVVIVDLEPDQIRGMEIVTAFRQSAPLVPVVVVAANPSIEFARRIRQGGVFFLALAPVTPDEIRAVLANAFECLGRKRTDTSSCLAKRRVLVVDDDADFTASIAALLESCGYTVSVARSGREGLEKVRTDGPDLIVLDVMMEYDASGYEVTQAVKFGSAFEAYRHIPILMVSSIPTDPATRFSMAGEVEMVTPSRYMTKPVDIQAFLENVRQLLGEKPQPVTA